MSTSSLSYFIASIRPRRNTESDSRGRMPNTSCSAPTRLQRKPAMREANITLSLQEALDIDDTRMPPSAMPCSAVKDSGSESMARPRANLPTKLIGKDATVSRQSVPVPNSRSYINDRLLKYANSSSSDDTPSFGAKSSLAELKVQLRRTKTDYENLQQDTRSMLASKDREVETAHSELSMAWQEVGRLVQRDIATRGDLGRAEAELKAVKATLEESLKLSEARTRSVEMLQEDQRVLQAENEQLRARLSEVTMVDVAGDEKEVMQVQGADEPTKTDNT